MSYPYATLSAVLHSARGASIYDVRIRGGRGSWKSGSSEGGCVNFMGERLNTKTVLPG